MKPRFLIIGGDDRQLHLKRRLDADFYDTFHLRYPADISALYDIEHFSHIILPIPVSKDKLSVYSTDSLSLSLDELRGKLQSCHIVYGSGFSERFIGYMEEKSITFYDLMKDKTFKLLNAYLTAQGAARELLVNTDDTVSDKRALIIGSGDVAVTLADKLKALGVDVYFAARNQLKLSAVSLSGYKTMSLEMIGELIYLFDFIFGTVPFNILNEADVRSMGDDSVYFELASAPYTADKGLFERFGKRYILSSSLPGKYLPKASSKIIYDFILNNM